MRFLIQAPNFVGIFTFPRWSIPDVVFQVHFFHSSQLAANEIIRPETPYEVLCLTLFV